MLAKKCPFWLSKSNKTLKEKRKKDGSDAAERAAGKRDKALPPMKKKLLRLGEQVSVIQHLSHYHISCLCPMGFWAYVYLMMSNTNYMDLQEN